MKLKACFLTEYNMGDAICLTPLFREVRKQWPHWKITLAVRDLEKMRILRGSPVIDQLICSALVGEWCQIVDRAEKPGNLQNFDLLFHLSAGAALNQYALKGLHLSEAYGRLFGVCVTHIYPILAEPKSAGRGNYVVLSPHTQSNQPQGEDGIGNKQWAFSNWQKLGRLIQEKFRRSVCEIGSEDESPLNILGAVPLYGLPIWQVATLLKDARLVITVDNGIAHICAAFRVPMIEIYPKCLPSRWTSYPYARVIYANPKDLTVEEVWKEVQEELAA